MDSDPGEVMVAEELADESSAEAIEAPPGAVGRALDLQLAELAAGAENVVGDGSAWAGLDLESLRDDDDDDAVPEVVEAENEDFERSVRYPSIEEAVASIASREPDPSALDFDDSEIDQDKGKRSSVDRLPTAAELLESQPPEPPELPELAGNGDAPEVGGDLAIDPPIRVLYKLMSSQATGLLVVSLGGIRKDIYLVDGAPVFVSSNLARELFGEYLVAQGVLSHGELSMSLAMMPHYGGKLGDTLVGLGLLKPLEVFRLLNQQVRMKLVDVCTWAKGDYGWYPGRENPREAFPFDLDRWEVLGAGAMAIPAEIATAFAESRAVLIPKPRDNPLVSPADFQIEGNLAGLHESLSDGKRILELRARFADGPQRIRFYRLLCLMVYTELITLEE